MSREYLAYVVVLALGWLLGQVWRLPRSRDADIRDVLNKRRTEL